MLRQFVIDDKGAVIIWCFGLPGCAFEDNVRRGLRSAFDVVDALITLGLSPRVGITLGNTFCGLVGAPYRCEYAVMGPCVNLAARLMGECYKFNARVLCNDELREKLGAQRAKGEIAEYFFTAQVGRPAMFSSAPTSPSQGARHPNGRDARARARRFGRAPLTLVSLFRRLGSFKVKGYEPNKVAFFRPEITRASADTDNAPRRHGAPSEPPTQTTAQLSPSQKTSRPALRATFVSRHRALSVDGRASAVGVATFGRAREMAVLRGAVGSLALGLGGGVVTIQGMPGIGKRTSPRQRKRSATMRR